MKSTITLFLLCLLGSCSAPKIEYPDYKSSISDSARKNYLTEMQAAESKYSMLFFTAGYDKRPVKVTNCNAEIFSDTLNMDRVLDLAESLRIDNTCEVVITDIKDKYSFNLKLKHITKYKYIYISRDWDSGKYSIAYSNSLRGFY